MARTGLDVHRHVQLMLASMDILAGKWNQA